MTDSEFKTFDAHFPASMSRELVDYARDVVFLWSRYLFVRREGKQQYGFCTHCRQESTTFGLKQGETTMCPACSSECLIKSSGRGRGKMVDEAYFVYYEKSLTITEAITARGLYAVRDYRGNYSAVETLVEVKAMYVFEPGKATMLERPWLYYSTERGMSLGDSWQQRKSVSSLTGSVMLHKPCYCSRDSIKTAVQGTSFQYSTWESYQDGDMVKFFDLYAKYPCVEYLTKLGMRGLVDAKLHGDKTYGAINWRGKNPLKVLKIGKQEMNELRASGAPVTPWLLRLRSLSKKDGSNLSISELTKISADLSEAYHKELGDALKRTKFRTLTTYLTKQLAQPDVYKYYNSLSRLLDTWIDYLQDCAKLGLDVEVESVKFPRDLYRAHQNTIKQIKVKADETLREKIEERSKALQKMRFEARGFVLRAAEDAQELIEEGKALQHCVGTYARQYALGETDLFVVRRLDEPDKPFYTMEIRNGQIKQCRGLKNCAPTDDLQVFVNLFVAKKLLTKKRARVGIAV